MKSQKTNSFVPPAEIWGFDHRLFYTAPGLLAIGRAHLSQKENNFGTGVSRARLKTFKLLERGKRIKPGVLETSLLVESHCL